MKFNILLFVILIHSCLGAPITSFSSVKPIIQETPTASEPLCQPLPTLRSPQIIDIVCTEDELLNRTSAVQIDSVSYGSIS